jgi:hypothetical protein
MPTSHLSIAKDFSAFPAGRERKDGPYSGERFREEILMPRLESSESLEIDLDGTMGYGSSFLEEAFGGLVRYHNMRYENLKDHLQLHDTRKIYEKLVWKYIQEESNRVFGG